MAKVNVKALKGMMTGCSVYINDTRVAGQKPWGGAPIIAEFNVEEKDILDALKPRSRGSEQLKKALDVLKPKEKKS